MTAPEPLSTYLVLDRRTRRNLALMFRVEPDDTAHRGMLNGLQDM